MSINLEEIRSRNPIGDIVGEKFSLKQSGKRLIGVWTEELVAGGKIELENFLVLEAQTVDRGVDRGILTSGEVPRYIRKVSLRLSKRV